MQTDSHFRSTSPWGSRRAGRWAGVAAILGLLIASNSVRAQVTLTTDETPAPTGSLRAEVVASTPGSTIDVQLDPGGTEESVIQLESVLPFDNSVVLDNSDTAFAPATIRSPNDGNLFEIEAGVGVTLRDVGIGSNGQNGSDDINLQAATSSLTFDISRGDQGVFSDIVGTGSVVKTGSSTLELGGLNTFSGGLTIQQGDVLGDVLSLGIQDGTGVVDFAGSATATRLILDIDSSDFIDATSPMITNSSTNGGTAQIVKRGEGSLALFSTIPTPSSARIDGSIGFLVEAGELVADQVTTTNNHTFDVRSDATLLLTSIGIASSSSVLSGEGRVQTEAVDLTLTGDLSSFDGVLDVDVGFIRGLVRVAPVVAPATPLTFDVELTPDTSFDIVNNFDIDFAGNINGNGEFNKSGPGTTRLTGAAANLLRTTISDGLLIGNTNNLRGTINISGAGSLEFDQATPSSFVGQINSTSPTTVTKSGAGVLTLTSAQPFAGDLDVRAGGINFATGAELTNANLTIGQGAIGSRTLLLADFTPGGDNTIDIGGALTLDADVSLTVDLDDVTSSNTLFAAGGAVDIDTSAQLNVRLRPGTYASPNNVFTILTGSSVSGDFAIPQNLFFFDIVGVNTGSTYQVRLNPNSNSFTSVAMTPNQIAVGSQLDTFRTGTNGGDPSIIDLQGALTIVGAADAGDVLGSVAGDDLAASTSIGLASATRSWRSLSNRLALHRNQSIGHHNAREDRREVARRKRAERLRKRAERTRRPSVDANAASTSPADAPAATTHKPWVAWFEGSGALGEIDSEDAKGIDYSLVGPLIGADTALTENVRVGFAVGMTYSEYEASGRADSEGDAYAAEGIVYGAWLGSPVEALLAVRYAHGWVETDRRIQLSSISNRVEGEFESDTIGFYAELTHGFALPWQIDLAPLASVAYARVMSDDFDETGLSPLRMQVEESDVDSAVTSLGVRIATERKMDQGFVFRPRLKALWNHEWADVEREVVGRFAGATTTGGTDFGVEGAEIPRDHAEVSAGWEIAYGANANLFLDWDGRFGSDFIENSISIGARVAW